MKILLYSLLVVLTASVANSQCTNTSAYGSATAPSPGNTASISTCNYQTEYSTISAVVSGQEYVCTNSSGGYVTVRSGSSGGTVVAHGNSPLTWTAVASGNHYVHWNTNSSCGTATGCTATSISATAGPVTVPVCYDMSGSTGGFTNGSGGAAWYSGTTSTTSSGTGPQGADADGGSGFYFTEASGGLTNTTYGMSGTFDLSGGSYQMTMDYHMYGGDMGNLRVNVDGVEVFSVSGNLGNVWNSTTIDLSAYSGASTSITILSTTGPNWASDCAIDNVCISALAPPSCASNLSPANSATNVSTLPTLSWDAVSVATAYDVYFGTLSQLLGSGLPLVSNDQVGTTYNPSALSGSSTYYWKVVPIGAGGEATGCSALSFTTQAPTPTIATSGSLSAFSGCSGSASSSDNFSVSGVDMNAGITVTAPTGYEVSTDNSSFSSSLVVGSSGTIGSTTIYVRLTNSASGSPSGNVVCSSSGATSQNIAASGSVNSLPSGFSASSSASGVCSGSTVDLSTTYETSASPSASCYATSTADTYISNVSVNGVNNPSASNIINVESNETDVVFEAVQGATYSMYATTADDAGSAYTHGISWFIDWNNDGDFDDANEFVLSTNGYVAIGTYGNAALTLPSSASIGDKKMRVVANESSGAPASNATFSFGESELYIFRVLPASYSWSSDVGGYTSSSANPTGVSLTENTTYTLTLTDASGCSSSNSTSVAFYENPVAGSVAVTDLSVSGNSDLTEAIEADQITWTNTGTANGNIQYFFEWTDNSGTSPTGAWNAWVTSNPNVWNANSSGGNMNRTLWVKTVTTSTNGCGTAESSTTWIDVRNCRAGATGATVSAGTVANMPFGETITYTATMDDGAWERFQYQWGGTGGNWVNWNDANTNPYSYTTDANAGQTLYVRSQVFGPAIGTATCTDYSDPVQTLLIDCANTVTADAGSDEVVCNGSSVVLAGSGSGSSAVTGYSWSPSTELSSSTIAGPTSSATSSRTYTLTTTHADGCTATDAVVVSVNEAPSNSSVAISSASTPPKKY